MFGFGVRSIGSQGMILALLLSAFPRVRGEFEGGVSLISGKERTLPLTGRRFQLNANSDLLGEDGELFIAGELPSREWDSMEVSAAHPSMLSQVYLCVERSSESGGLDGRRARVSLQSPSLRRKFLGTFYPNGRDIVLN